MGYNNEFVVVTGKSYLGVDIETCPMPNCHEYLTDAIEAPSNYKDPAKIAQYIHEKRAKHIADAGLDLDLCEIVAIGIALPDIGYVQTRAMNTEDEMIRGLWNFVKNVQRDGGVLVGFNCLAFDLPILFRRSLYLGIPTPTLSLDKYRHDGIVDVAHELSYGGRMTWRSLAFYAKRFGIPHDDSVTGEQIAGLVSAGEWEKVAAHVRADVTTTVALARRVGLIYQSEPEEAPAETLATA